VGVEKRVSPPYDETEWAWSSELLLELMPGTVRRFWGSGNLSFPLRSGDEVSTGELGLESNESNGLCSIDK
jgi:hypothetical protein